MQHFLQSAQHILHGDAITGLFGHRENEMVEQKTGSKRKKQP
jgi:hypothetical protein